MTSSVGLRAALAALLLGSFAWAGDAWAAARSVSLAPSERINVGGSSGRSAGGNPLEAIRETVLAWSAALDRHDVQALESLYGASVLFYGKPLSRSMVVASKRAAFSKQPAFRQELVGDVAIVASGEGTFTARFTKRAGPADHLADTRASLVLQRQPGNQGGLAIVEETDEATEARRAKETAHEPKGEGSLSSRACRQAAAKAVRTLASVQGAITEAQHAAAESRGEAHYGGMTPIDGDDGFTEEWGLQSADRFEAVVSYSVNRSGHLTVTVGAEDVPVPLATARSVEKACRR